MALEHFTLDEKLAALEVEIVESRRTARPPGSAAQRHHQLLKAIAADVRGRQEFPRSNALGAIEREIERVQRSKTALGYDRGCLEHLANVTISKWPTISQALERFGEESTE